MHRLPTKGSEPTQRRSRCVASFAACLLLAGMLLPALPSFAQTGNPAAEPRAEASKKEYEAKLKRIGLLQEQIRLLYRAPTPDLHAIGRLYESIFAVLPNDQQGQMAAWEAYHVYRRAQDATAAMSVLRTIYGSYRPDAEMDNPFGEGERVRILATADLEQAWLYADLMHSPLVAIEQMHNIPIRHPGAFVGISDGDRSYFGKVDTIVLWKTAQAHVEAEQYNAAIGRYRELVAERGLETIRLAEGPRGVEWLAVRAMGAVLRKMPASHTKKTVEIEELGKLLRSPVARAEAHFVKAGLFEDSFAQTQNAADLGMAETEYRSVLKETPNLRFDSSSGVENMGPRAVAALAKLLGTHARRPDRALQILLEIEQDGRNSPESLDVCAYARLHAASIELRERGNARQAENLLADFVSLYGSVVLYPFNEKSPRYLLEAARDLRKEAERRQGKSTQERSAP